MSELNKSDILLLQRAATSPIEFVYSPCVNSPHVKLTRSSISQSQKKHLHRLAVGGYLAEATGGCGGHGEPPETKITFTLTAMGRQSLGIHAATRQRERRGNVYTDAALEAEAGRE